MKSSNEPLLTSMVDHRDSRWSWIGIEEGTDYIHRISRLTATAARRQVVADTVATCMVSDYVPKAGRHDERLGEFIYDVDGNRGPMAIVNWSHTMIAPPESRLSVNTRKDVDMSVGVITPPSDGTIDLDLGHYSDVFTTEDLVVELPVRKSDGFADTSNIARISKVIPWYDEFVESFKVKSMPSIARVTKLARLSFIKLKILYWRLASLYHSMYAYYWVPVVVSKRLEILRSNFSRGILGLRALENPEDPRVVRALIMKEADNKRLGVRRHLQTFSSSNASSSVEDKENNKDDIVEESSQAPVNPHATLPDLQQVWQVKSIFPRVHLQDTNRVVYNMAHMERESMNGMAQWSMGEVRMFLEKIAVHGKNFKRIASTIVDKSERDCVEFYYRFKIHLNMKAVIAAGSLSRQDRRTGGIGRADNINSNQSTPVISGTTITSYKAMIDEILDELECELGGTDKFLSTQSMKFLNLKYSHGAASNTRTIPRPRTPMSPGDESPRRERRNAMIDLIVTAIGKGHPIPQELGVVETITPPLTPGLTATSLLIQPPLVAAVPVMPPPPPPPRRVSLSVVQTEISVLTLAEERQLQPHHTI